MQCPWMWLTVDNDLMLHGDLRSLWDATEKGERPTEALWRGVTAACHLSVFSGAGEEPSWKGE